jgi:hypothetical protein
MPGPKRNLCRPRIDVASPAMDNVFWSRRGVALESIEHGLDPQCRYGDAKLAVPYHSLSQRLDRT